MVRRSHKEPSTKRVFETSRRTVAYLFLGLTLIAGFITLTSGKSYVTQKVSAACVTTAVPTTYGQVTQNINVGTAGTYRLWSRIKVPSTAANSYYFKLDGGCNYNVGDSGNIVANTWTWVNYQDASTAAFIDLTLSTGAHTLTYTGKEADVQLSQLMLLNDLSCVPTGNGENCATTDTTAPTVSLTAPAAGTTVTGNVTLAANASAASGISKVDFLVDGVVVGSDSSPSYSYSWASSTVTNGSHGIQARAYDIAGNASTSTAAYITTNNATTTPTPPPPTPGDPTKPVVSITSPADNSAAQPSSIVNFNVMATDKVTVTRVDFLIDGVLKNTLQAPPYNYPWNTTGYSNAAHTLTAKAYDADGNTTTSPPTTVYLGVAAPPPGPTPPPTPPSVPGDVNGDSRVNALDLSALISHDGENYAAADFNKDGTVGAADMAILLSKWTW